MNLKQSLTTLCIVAAMSSAGWSQTVPAPVLHGVPVGSAAPADANGQPSFYPTQIQQAYGLVSLMGGTGTNAITNNGAGQTIAIIDAYNYPNALSTLNIFSLGNYSGNGSSWTLPAMSASGAGPIFTQLNQNGGTTLPTRTNSNWAGEEALDIEYVHAMAPMANIILYEANSDSNSNLNAAITAARNNPAVSVVTMSWGGPESSSDPSNNSLFTTPASRLTGSTTNGITFCASAGDGGDINESPGNTSSGFPATSPNVVGVGGTSLYLNSNNSYNHETAWSWNASANNGAGWGGGGGISTVQAKPSYQTGYGTAHPGNILATTTSCAVPDVALDADPYTGVYVYDSFNAGSGSGWFTYYGGTSLASPLFAGLVADADEIRSNAGHGTLDGPSQTLPALYSLPSDFNQITSGNISPTGDSNYSAGPGYNLATGLGSPIANLLVPDLANYGVVVVATSYHWASASSGNWSSSANWTFAVPNGIGAAAVINVPTTSQLTVTLDEPFTLGSLLLGNAASSSVGYTISGSGSNTLTLNNSGSGATIAVVNGSHQINAPVILSDNLLVTSSGANSWTLSFGSANSITDNGGGFSLTMSGSGGMLVLGGANSYTGGTNVSAGTLVATSVYSLPIGSRLSISAAGTVNLGSNALVTNDPSSGMTGGALVATYHDVGYSGTGTFTQSGGTNTLSNGLYIGCNPGDNGTYNLSGGSLAAAAESVGLFAAGVLVQTGGTNTVAGALDIGNYSGSSGTYNLRGGQLTAATQSVGTSGAGMFSQSGGTNTAGTFTLGNANSGTYTLSAGQLTAGVEHLGYQGAATFNQTGGINAVAGSGSFVLGYLSGGSGSYTLGGSGQLNAPIEVLGYSGTGAFSQSGGTNTVSNSSPLYLGFNTGGSGSYTLSGGQLSAQYEYVGLSGSGNFTQSGGIHVAGNLVLGDNAGSAGAYNLNGGLLNVAALSGGSGNAAFNFSGGTFQAASSFSANVPIALGLAGSNGVFDTQGYTLTLAAPLSGPGGLQKLGSGTLVLTASNSYTGTTLVSAGTLDVNGMLSGGSVQVASGATLGFAGPIDSTLMLAGGLVATGSGTVSLGALSGSSGTITNDQAGSLIDLVVGGLNTVTSFSGAILDGSGTLALTKVGTGTLVLSGTDSYSGGTTVQAGRLRVMDPYVLPNGADLTVGNASYFAAALPAAEAAAAGTAAVPEPGTLALLGAAAALGLLTRLRRRSRL